MPTNAQLVDLLETVSTRYVFGGTRYDVYDTDCSGVVCGAFWRVFGLDPYTLGTWTGAQWDYPTTVKLWWGESPNLPFDSMQRGDLIFTSNCSPDFSTGNGSHIGFYTGNPDAPFISHFADGCPCVTAVNGVYGNERYYGVKRYMPGSEDDLSAQEVWDDTRYQEPYGTGASMGTRLVYIDKYVNEIKAEVDEIKKQLATISTGGVDVDALASAVADKLAARLQE